MGKILRICNRVTGFTSAGLLFIMMVIIVIDVCSRYLLNKPLPGTIEFTRVFMAAVIFLGLAHAEEFRAHIRAKVFISRLPEKFQILMDIFAWFAGLFLFAIIAWQGFDMLIESWNSREFYPGVISVPIYPARLLVVLGSLLLCIQFIFNIVQRLLGHPEDVSASH